MALSRLGLLRLAGRFILPSYRFTWPTLDWWNDRWFTSYLDKFGETKEFNTYRRYMLWQLALSVHHLRGATAEAGVYQGAGSYLICEANRRAGGKRHHHGYDSFSGLSKPGDADQSYWKPGDLTATEQSARENLKQFDGSFTLHAGWIPDVFSKPGARLPKKDQFVFVHIDVDLYEPTRDSLAYFYPKMVPGGIIVCDDYGFTTCPGATRAMDEFLTRKKESIVGLPAGGGFFIKH